MPNLICPVCSHPLDLTASKKSRSCEQGHLFDVAKQGYLNLLLSQHKKSKHPGDTTSMVQARSDFLNLGHYQSITDTIISLVSKNSQEKITHYCDLACGEGYYTHHLEQYFASKETSIQTTGIDISSPAIKAACKRSKSIQWLIASTRRIPLEDNSQNLVTGLFFHFDLQEVLRVLKKNGLFILVSAGENHLIELRELLYDTIKHEQKRVVSNKTMDLVHVNHTRLEQNFTLENSHSIQQLLTMTPHFWRSKPEKKQALNKITTLNLNLDITFDVFMKH